MPKDKDVIFTVFLKGGLEVRIPWSFMDKFMELNKDLIEVRQVFDELQKPDTLKSIDSNKCQARFDYE